MSRTLLRPLDIKADKDNALYNQGNALFKSRRNEEAITSFNQGVALFYRQRYKEAIASFDKSLEIQPGDYEAWLNRGLALDDWGHHEEAVASYNQALQIKRDFYEAWYSRGNALERLGYHDKAISSYNRALETKPDLHQAWNGRGVVLADLGHHEEAIASYNKALEIQSGDHEVWNNRGIALGKLGNFEEAITSFDKALELKPDYADTFYNKACCYALQGNVEQAIENLQQAINLSPDEYRKDAKTDSDFDSIREDERFQALIQEKRDWEQAEINDSEWLQTAATNPAFDFLEDLKQDIYTLDDGKSFNEQEDKPSQAETKILHNISWEKFENILVQMGDNRSSRLAYDQGTLEITMPSQKHEYYKEIIGDLIKYLAEELDLDCEALGSTTWKRKDLLKGAEPDNCFYIQNEPAIRSIKPNIDLSKDPPPDLILEVDYTSPSLDRQSIYAGLGVPEIWLYDVLSKRVKAQVLSIYQLEAGKYKETDISLAFGKFPVKQIPSFIEQNITASPRAFRQAFRDWVRQYLAEKYQEGKTER